MTGGLLSDLAVYVAQDCTVYKEDVINLCTVEDQPAASLDITVHDFQIIGTYRYKRGSLIFICPLMVLLS